MSDSAVIGLILVNEYALVLPRKEKQGWYGLPGGKIENLESHEQALLRELDEELGIIPTKYYLVSSELDDWDFITHTYLIEEYTGFLAGEVKFLHPKDLCSYINCPFARHNYDLFTKLKLI